MLIFLTKPATDRQIQDAVKDLDGYIKITIDIKRKKAVIGGRLHVDAKQLLLTGGSRQNDIWGGGYDTVGQQIDYNSIINLRLQNNNPSEEIIVPRIRKQFEKLVKYFLSL